MLIAIDHGNKLIKTKNNSFISGISKFDTKPPFGEKILEFNGLFYSLSTKRLFYMKDKTIDENYFILTLFAIAQEIESRNVYETDKCIDIKLIVGLPPSHYSKLHCKFEDYFVNRGRLNFTINAKKYLIEISSVSSFPQSYAAFISKYNEFKSFHKAIILDIGGYTADYLIIRNGVPDLDYCDSLDNGIAILYNNIVKKVSSELEFQLEENDIDNIIKQETTVFNDDIAKIVTSETKKFVTSLLGDLIERKLNTKQDKLIIIGGGGMLLKDFFIQSDLAEDLIVINDIFANVKGYEILHQLSNRVDNSWVM